MVNSNRLSYKGVTTMVVATLFSAVLLAVVGQLIVKHGLNVHGDMDFSGGLIRGFARVFMTPWVVAGSAVYASSVLFWVYTLTKVDLSYAYPFVSLNYVLVIVASRFILSEAVPPLRWIGVVVICIGVFIVAFT